MHGVVKLIVFASQIIDASALQSEDRFGIRV